MAARKRKENESFKQYRKNLISEAAAQKAKKVVLWASSQLVPHPITKQLVSVADKGTYIKRRDGALI